MDSFVRISALLWADVLVAYAFFAMQKYLTDVWKISFTHAAGILNIWGGISKILPVFYLLLVNPLLRNLKMLVVFSIAYSVGIGFIAVSTPPVLASFTNTCKEYKPQCIGHTGKALFYAGMALVAVGMAGNLLYVKPFFEERKDKSTDSGKQKEEPNANMETRNCLRIPGSILVVLVAVIGAFALPYVKPWSLRFGIPAICTAFATLLFFSGFFCWKYDKVGQQENPPTDTRRVFVAFAVRMIPMWITFIVYGIVSSMGNTYFIEQANHLNRRLGSWNLPLQILLLLYKVACKFFSILAVRFSNKYRPRVGIAIAIIFSILCCVTAAVIEKRRLDVIKSHGLLDKPEADIPMSAFWLLFQFFLLAGFDAFFKESVAIFNRDQAPESMRNYLRIFTEGVSGLGFMFSVLMVYVVGKVSEKGGRRNWFQYTLSRSRLDRYYWVLAGLSLVNLVVFVFVASRHRYRGRAARDNRTVEGQEYGQPTNATDEGNCLIII